MPDSLDHTISWRLYAPCHTSTPGRSYLYNVAGNLDLSSYGNGLDADGVKLYCAKVMHVQYLMPRHVSD